MGKRQIRFTGKKLISNELIGKEVNVVLLDGTVDHLKILSLFPDYFLTEDMRKNKHKIPFKDVYEIILDFTSAY